MSQSLLKFVSKKLMVMRVAWMEADKLWAAPMRFLWKLN